MSKVVCASDYGGPGDPSSGTTGYRGDNLNGRMAFAELRMGTALGMLPHGAKARIEYNGKSVIAEKLDIGLGGPGCGGHSREIDLWYQTAQALGFNGLAPVTVTLPGEPSRTDAKFFGVPGIPNPAGPLGEAGEELLQGKTPNPLGSIEGPIEAGKNALSAGSAIVKLIQLLTSPKGWIRIGKVTVGLFLLMMGVLGMANVSAAPVVAPVAVPVSKAYKAEIAAAVA